MPWARATAAAASTSEVSMAFITPSDWSRGVEGTLAVRILPPPSATRSVNVPPTSTPRRRSLTFSDLVLRVKAVGYEHVTGAVCDHQRWPDVHRHRLGGDPTGPEDGHLVLLDRDGVSELGHLQ